MNAWWSRYWNKWQSEILTMYNIIYVKCTCEMNYQNLKLTTDVVGFHFRLNVHICIWKYSTSLKADPLQVTHLAGA